MFFPRKAYYLLIGFFSLASTEVVGQDQKLADSLELVYHEDDLNDTMKLELLRNLSFNESSDINKALYYSRELISLSSRIGNKLYLYRGHFQKGNNERLLGNLDSALSSYFKSSEIARQIKFQSGEGSAYGAIADIYSVNGNHMNAMRYYNKAISTLRQATDSIGLASAISNAGDEYLSVQKYDSALMYFEEAGDIFNRLQYVAGVAYSLGNKGMVYASLGRHDLAEKHLRESIKILDGLKDFYPICVYLLSMADIYSGRRDFRQAVVYAKESLLLSKRYRLKEQIAEASLKLSTLYEQAGDLESSYGYYKDYIVYRDSLSNVKLVQTMAELRADYEVAEKQMEVDLLHEQKRNLHLIQVGLVLLFVTITSGLVIWLWQKRRINKELQLINQEVNELNESKDKFFSIISHDLKGPLNSLTSFSSLLLNHADNLTQDEIKMISLDLDKSLKNLFALLENLLQWSLSQSGHIDFTPEIFDMAVVLKENEVLLKDIASYKEIRMITEGEPSVNVYANYNSINTVVRNLISNAIKFTPEGGEIRLSMERMDRQLQVSVKDTGTGISQPIMEKLFKIDSKHSSLGTAREKGTGLGLIICKDFMEKNGGSIRVESAIGKGSIFYIMIPLG